MLVTSKTILGRTRKSPRSACTQTHAHTHIERESSNIDYLLFLVVVHLIRRISNCGNRVEEVVLGPPPTSGIKKKRYPLTWIANDDSDGTKISLLVRMLACVCVCVGVMIVQKSRWGREATNKGEEGRTGRGKGQVGVGIECCYSPVGAITSGGLPTGERTYPLWMSMYGLFGGRWRHRSNRKNRNGRGGGE